MNLTVRVFATLKDRLGASSIEIDLPEKVSVKTFLSNLVSEYPVLEPSLETIIVAVNQEFANPDQILTPEDEIVLFPPVSGG